MNNFSWLQNLVQSIWNDVARLFQPSNDNYPQSGIQPFEGEPYDDEQNS